MIQIINPQLDSSYLDIWGEYFPFALQPWIPILEAGCFKPRWFQAPINALAYMTAGDYNSWSLQLPAGSFILEILHTFQSAEPNGHTAFEQTGSFQVQITDTGLDYLWFSQPMPDKFFFKRNGRNGYVLPKPYPVLSPGNFQVERWCGVTGTCELLFVVAVPEQSA